MLLPYATDCRPKEFPAVTVTLLAVTVLTTLAALMGSRAGGGASAHLALTFFGLTPAHFRIFDLFTYSFFHDGLLHLAVNLLYLWVFGAGVEAAVGSRAMLLLYFGGAVVGGLFQTLFSLQALSLVESAQPIVGASAACSCLIGIYAVRYYRARLAFVGLPFRPQVTLVVALVLSAEMSLGALALIRGASSDGVAHWAHVSGFVFGLVSGLSLRLDAAGSTAYLHSDAAALLQRAEPGAALRRCEALLAANPDDADAYRATARAWALLGDQTNAFHHYARALSIRLSRSERAEAARLYAEMCGARSPDPPEGAERHAARSLRSTLSAAEMLALGNALQEAGDYAPAADVFRSLAVGSPNSLEAEPALLRTAILLARHLARGEEARILARLFLERYPASPFRANALELTRETDPSGPRGA